MRLTSQILNIAKSDQSSTDASGDGDDAVKEIAEAARKHYFYEECAAKVELCIRNDGDTTLNNVAIEIGMPRVPWIDVADRIYTNPFDKRSAGAGSHSRYPDVEHRDDAILVRTTITSIAAKETQSLLGTALRFAIRDKALGRKLGLSYVLRASDGRKLSEGRVKIRFKATEA